jgi:hypothetical protein
MKFLDRLLGRRQEAAATTMTGASVVKGYTPMGYIDRTSYLSPERIAANRSVPVVLECLTGLSRMCFSGFDHVLKPLDPSDDTQAANIEKAMQQIRIQEKRIGRIGKAKKCGTINLVRAAALDGWSYRQALAEYSTALEGSWLNFTEIQHLPAQSFSLTPPGVSGDAYIADKILPGIIYDSNQDITRFFQSSASTGSTATEIDPTNLLYAEDVTVPDDVSFLRVLQPTIESWKEVRRYGMTAEKRIAVPNETARVDANDIVKMVEAKIPVRLQDLIDHCDDLAENQAYSNKKVALPATHIEYPSISMPLNPWEADKYLREEVVSFFFKRDVLEVTTQAISASNNAAKDLLDLHVASEREIWGKPFETLWSDWLAWNGFELVDEFDWWNWSPEDQKAEHEKNLQNYRSHAMTVNEFRRLEGLPELDEAGIKAMAAEHEMIFGNKDNALARSDTIV